MIKYILIIFTIINLVSSKTPFPSRKPTRFPSKFPSKHPTSYPSRKITSEPTGTGWDCFETCPFSHDNFCDDIRLGGSNWCFENSDCHDCKGIIFPTKTPTSQ